MYQRPLYIKVAAWTFLLWTCFLVGLLLSFNGFHPSYFSAQQVVDLGMLFFAGMTTSVGIWYMKSWTQFAFVAIFALITAKESYQLLLEDALTNPGIFAGLIVATAGVAFLFQKRIRVLAQENQLRWIERAPRIDLQVPSNCEIENSAIVGRTVNISATGCLLKLPQIPVKGATVKVDFLVKDFSFHSDAVVVRIDENEEVAVRFIHRNMIKKWKLGRVLA